MTTAPAAAALVSTVEQLWPDARVEVVRARRPDPTARADLVVLPDSRRPRLLLPTSRRAAAGAVNRFSAAASRREVLARTAASAAFRLGATGLLPERIRVHGGSDDSLADHLAAQLGERSIDFSLGIGPARVNRKPVLQLFAPDGRTVGFAKVGTTDTSRADVTAEAQALGTLTGRRLTTLRAPRPLYVGEWRGLVVLVQEHLAVPARRLLRGRTPTPLAAMDELTDAFPGDPVPLTQLPWWDRCSRQGSLAPDPLLAGRFQHALDRLAAAHPDPVDVGAWHGDWTPWNMAPDGDRVLVWDWERFETGVPRGLDRMHHAVNVATLAHGHAPDVVRRALVEAGADPARGAGRPTGAAYLVAVTARYLAMSAAPTGELIVPRAEAMLVALERWLDRTDA